ncbi:hypothetical protein GJ496_011078 [Pomphorhynchus laevis]|nr:hypothetical protein GJ496_011078 [Pomphorhynchus laevis]
MLRYLAKYPQKLAFISFRYTHKEYQQSAIDPSIILDKALDNYVSKKGWTAEAIACACSEMSISEAYASTLSPFSIIKHANNRWDSELLAEFQPMQLSECDIISEAILYRLSLIKSPAIWHKALAISMQPQNAKDFLSLKISLCSQILSKLCNDRSIYLDWYCKRSALITLYTLSELYFISNPTDLKGLRQFVKDKSNMTTKLASKSLKAIYDVSQVAGMILHPLLNRFELSEK